MPLTLALCRVAPIFFRNSPKNAEIALRMVRGADELLRCLLQGSYVAAASRLIGAYQFLGFNKIAEDILQGMQNAGYKVTSENPFREQAPLLKSGLLIVSPYAARITVLWRSMRQIVIDSFPPAPGIPKNQRQYFASVEAQFLHDAYNSLSIEGYQVTEELIKKVEKGQWDPKHSVSDQQQYNAMAAKGYFEAFKAVNSSIAKVFAGKLSGRVVEEDLTRWYQALFSSLVKVGLVERAHLAGYRNQRVMIRGSQHVPPPKDALLDIMEAFFACLTEEPEASVRAVLGHFLLGYIHPFIDGNGRIARFLMNVMFASGGYPWTVVLLSDRKKYMQALEAASVREDIRPFAKFILGMFKHAKRRS